MWKPMETLSFEAGTVYTVWSNYRSLNIHMDNPQYGTAYSPKYWRTPKPGKRCVCGS